MLTSKQRAYLKSLANPLETILIVGKGGVSDDLIVSANEALEAREIIKGKMLETSPENVKEIAYKIAEGTGSEVVQTIGFKFVLYKAKKKDPIIKLPKERTK